MTQKKQQPDVFAILAETPLSGLIESLQTGKFQPPPDDPIGEKETVIGELTYAEKALWSATEILKEKANFIANTNDEMVEESKRKGENVDELQVFLNKSEHEATAKMFDSLVAVMWHSIKKRLGAPAQKADAIGIRNGYQLVSLPSDMDEAFVEMLTSGRGRLAMMAMLAGCGE